MVGARRSASKKLIGAARALYRKPPDAKVIAEFGLTREDYDEEVWLWPDNQRSWSLFLQVETQWRTAMGGATGLDYSILPLVFEMNCVPREDWKELFDDLRSMEKAALESMHKSSDTEA